jgi:hypothetical protein
VIATLVLVAVAVSSCARFAGPSLSEVMADPSQVSDAPSHGTAEEPLPMPDGLTIVEVLDPLAEAPPISADQALAFARASGLSNMVGESPRVQLAGVTGHDPDWASFTGWIILSTDLRTFVGGGAYAQPWPTLSPVYTYLFVTLDGELLNAIQINPPEALSSSPGG